MDTQIQLEVILPGGGQAPDNPEWTALHEKTFRELFPDSDHPARARHSALSESRQVSVRLCDAKDAPREAKKAVLVRQ
jgi:hypothetical protein